MRLIPTGSNVVVAKTKSSKKTPLILSEAVEDSIPALKRWKVAAIGPECKAVKLDDFIVFNAANAGEIPDGDQKYVIIQEKDILAVYSE